MPAEGYLLIDFISCTSAIVRSGAFTLRTFRYPMRPRTAASRR